MTVPAPERLKRYLTVFLRWLSITIVVFVVTLLSGAYITDHLLHKVYTATAEIQVRARDHTGNFDQTRFQSEFEIMQSPHILLPIIHDLDLDKAWAKRLSKSKEDQLTDQEALAHLNKILKLDVRRGTNIVAITVSSDVPQEAAAIANAIADRYKTTRDVEVNHPLQESPVRIISRAEPPEYPSKPNKTFCFIITLVTASVLSVMVASFVEMMLLFSRASEIPLDQVTPNPGH